MFWVGGNGAHETGPVETSKGSKARRELRNGLGAVLGWALVEVKILAVQCHLSTRAEILRAVVIPPGVSISVNNVLHVVKGEVLVDSRGQGSFQR